MVMSVTPPAIPPKSMPAAPAGDPLRKYVHTSPVPKQTAPDHPMDAEAAPSTLEALPEPVPADSEAEAAPTDMEAEAGEEPTGINRNHRNP